MRTPPISFSTECGSCFHRMLLCSYFIRMPNKRVPSSKTEGKNVLPRAKPRKKATRIVPLTAAESPRVREAVAAGDVPWEEAQKRLVAAIQGGRVWRTPEWHALRERLINDHCAQCSSTEGPFTLQHFWHPLTIPEAARLLRLQHRRRARDEYLIRYPIIEATEERQACPRCHSVNIYSRDRVTPRWKCNYRSGRRWCGHEFDQPVRVIAPAYKVNAAQTQASWTAFYAYYNLQYADMAESFNVQATLHVLELFERYLSGEGTGTFCRKCAFMWDQNGLRLCHMCRTEWHKHHEPACIVCVRGVRYVMCCACGEQRHSDAYPTCYYCAQKGITAVTASVIRGDEEISHTVVEDVPTRAPGSEIVSEARGPAQRRSPAKEDPTRGTPHKRGPRLTPTQCRVGTRVAHAMFGPGTIDQATQDIRGLISVVFDDAARGRKVLSLTHALLSLLGTNNERAEEVTA